MLRSLLVPTAFVCISAVAHGHASLQNACDTKHFLSEFKKVTDAKKGPNVWLSASFQNESGFISYRAAMREKFFSPISFLTLKGERLSIATFGSDYYPARILRLDSRGIVFGGVTNGVAPVDGM